MDITALLPQLGISAIFIAASHKLYRDNRQDSLRREEQIRQDSKEREEKLLHHLDKYEDSLQELMKVNKSVVDTLNVINQRLIVVEQCVKGDERK
jgi:esterase/lipase